MLGFKHTTAYTELSKDYKNERKVAKLPSTLTVNNTTKFLSSNISYDKIRPLERHIVQFDRLCPQVNF